MIKLHEIKLDLPARYIESLQAYNKRFAEKKEELVREYFIQEYSTDLLVLEEDLPEEVGNYRWDCYKGETYFINHNTDKVIFKMYETLEGVKWDCFY